MPAKRIPLKRAEILSAALHIIDAEGADALSMRRLARDLGVEAMSLYHHFASKDAILAGVIDLALEAEAPAPPTAPPPSWREPVMAAVLGFRRVLVKHPNVLPVMATHPPTSGSSTVYIEGPLRYLLARGLSEAEATDLFQSVFALAFGHAMLSTSYGTIEIPGTPSFSFTEDAFTRTLDILLHGYDASATRR
jgi:AcrR family transcriptional regulator